MILSTVNYFTNMRLFILPIRCFHFTETDTRQKYYNLHYTAAYMVK